MKGLWLPLGNLSSYIIERHSHCTCSEVSSHILQNHKHSLRYIWWWFIGPQCLKKYYVIYLISFYSKWSNFWDLSLQRYINQNVRLSPKFSESFLNSTQEFTLVLGYSDAITKNDSGPTMSFSFLIALITRMDLMTLSSWDCCDNFRHYLIIIWYHKYMQSPQFPFPYIPQF